MRQNYEKPRPGKLVDVRSVYSMDTEVINFLPVTGYNLERIISIVGMMYMTIFSDFKIFILKVRALKYC
jgi:hypothetical protein